MNNKKPLSPYSLGATLYMPALRGDLTEVLLKGKIEGLRSVVICLEDAVSESDVPAAMDNLQQVLNKLSVAKSSAQGVHLPLIFIRPRNEGMADELIRNYDLSVADGFVIPKFNESNMQNWFDIMQGSDLYMMPTLETEDVFDVVSMSRFASILDASPMKKRILALRIGGNDLMNVISLRRSRDLTLYDGPMGYVVKMLAATFLSKGFFLTAPVCEHIDDFELLEKELRLDIAHGLVGKTAIHPHQIPVIQAALMVSPRDHQDAMRIINSTQAVFKSGGSMCEPATHRNWAYNVLDRAGYFGVSVSIPVLSQQKINSQT